MKRFCLVLSLSYILVCVSSVDIQFPTFHVRPPKNWINDPNGPVYWDGLYHVFYQYNPDAAVWGNITWGHATSTDMFSWKYHDPILKGTPGSSDSGGVWSGTCLLLNGTANIMYTGALRDESVGYWIQSQSLAKSTDHFTTVQKYTGNPVISSPPPIGDKYAFRDPSFFYDEESGEHLLVIGSLCGGYGCVLLYRPIDTNFTQFEYLHPLYTGSDAGVTYECPDLFKLDGRYVLLYAHNVNNSIPDGNFYMVGNYVNKTFQPTTSKIPLDVGNAFYAARTFLDKDDRRILLSWSKEEREDSFQLASGWSCTLTFPKILSVSKDNNNVLQQRFVNSGEIFHGLTVLRSNMELQAQFSAEYELIGRQLFLNMTISDCTSKCFIDIRRSPSGNIFTRISLDRLTSLICINRTYSSDSSGVDNSSVCGDMPGLYFTDTRLEILVDNSILEILVNNTLSLTARIYPPDGCENVKLSTNGGIFKVSSLAIYHFVPETDDFEAWALILFTAIAISAIVICAIIFVALVMLFYTLIYKKFSNRQKYARFLEESRSYVPQ